MKPNKILHSQDFLRDRFEYVSGKLFKNKKLSGTVHPNGYCVIKINNIAYPAHRLIWIFHNGSIDENLQIDHINGIKDDNRIENLRLVTPQVNCFNRSRLKAKGYTWNKDLRKWQSSIFLNGKMKYLGLYSNEQDARNVYLANCKVHHQGINI